MSVHHDPPSEVLAGPSVFDAAGHDALSDVLRAVRLTGALYFMVDATSPWCVDVPEAKAYAADLLPTSQHIVSYHVVLEGEGVASVPGHDPVPFAAGDIIVFPHADAYRMESAPDTEPEFDREAMLGFFKEMAAGRLPFVIPEGGGAEPPAKFICGFLGLDARPFNPLLGSLPRLLRIPGAGRAGDDMLDKLIEFTVLEAQGQRAGSETMRIRLSELMFVDVLRRHLETMPSQGTGWLGGLRDPVVGKALTLLHGDLVRGWSLDDLARECGVSRSVLAERFMQLVGIAPMAYLTQWRMQCAARLLADSNMKIASVAAQVGYGSEAAFSRTFKKIAGMSPSYWRGQAKP